MADELHQKDYTITKLDLSGKASTQLPDDLYMYENLIELDCSKNSLTTLGILPKGLKILNCSHNCITSLDNLPQSLIYLDCRDNELTCLDNLPPNLIYLETCYNKITSLDYLPSSVKFLFCNNNNKITNLFNLPPNISVLQTSSRTQTNWHRHIIPNIIIFGIYTHKLLPSYFRVLPSNDLYAFPRLLYCYKTDITINIDDIIHYSNILYIDYNKLNNDIDMLTDYTKRLLYGLTQLPHNTTESYLIACNGAEAYLK